MRSSIQLPIALISALACGGGGAGGSGGAATAPPDAVEPATYLGPVLTVDAPSRGAMLAEGGEDPGPVIVRGQACDGVHALTALRIGETDLAPSSGAACQAFEAPVQSRWGLSVVTGKAVNSAGEVGTLAQALLRSPTWFTTAPGDAAARAGSGIVLRLGQAFLDDGDRSTPDDVATIAERALSSVDLDAAVGERRVAQPDADGDGEIDTATYHCLLYTTTQKRTGFRAWKSGPVASSGITVDELRLEDGGLSARVTVHAPRVPFGVTGTLDSGCLGGAQKTVTGEARADAIALAGRAQVSLDASGRPRVAFESLSATLVNLDLAISLGELVDWTGLGDLIGDAIAGEVRGPIQDAVAGAVRGSLDARLSELLGTLAGFQTSFALPPALGGAALRVESGIDRLEFTAQQAVIGTAIQVRPGSPSAAHAGVSRGAMRMGGTPPDPGLFAGTALALAIGDDALNQLLHAAWLAGAFDVDDLARLVPLAGVPVSRLSLRPQLPPVLMPRQGGAPGVDVGWGDVGFELELTSPRAGARVKGFLSIVLPLERLEVDAGGTSAHPVFGRDAEVHVQVDEVNWDHLPTTRAVVTALLESLLRSTIVELLGGAVGSFALPELDLRSLDPGLPPLHLSLEDARMTRLGRYQAVAGRVAAAP